MDEADAIKVMDKLATNGHNVSALARAAGVPVRTAAMQVEKAKDMLKNRIVKNDKFDEMLEDVAMKALQAMRPVVTKDDIIYVDDWHARYKFWKDILVMKGWYDEKPTINANQFNITISDKDRKILEAIDRENEGTAQDV